MERELERYEEQGEDYMEEIGKSMPTIKKVLIDERNEHMAKYLLAIEERFGTVLALVGDGHVPGILRLIPHGNKKEIRLRDVKAWRPAQEDVTSMSYTFNV